MDCKKVGELIYRLRKEKHMTQKEVAEAMNISDKAVSKWERGMGCPDVSLLNELSGILGVNIEKILQGDLDLNDTDGGNMKRIRFYVCPNCGNIASSTGDADISCCGRKLEPLAAKPEDDEHRANVEEMEEDYYVAFSHDMSKSHFIAFVAYVMGDRVLLVRLYPEQGAELRFPRMYRGRLYYYCSLHGLHVRNL